MYMIDAFMYNGLRWVGSWNPLCVWLLRGRYFGGGTVSGVVASADVVRRPAGVLDAGQAHVLLEDGTLNFHGIAGTTVGGMCVCVYMRMCVCVCVLMTSCCCLSAWSTAVLR